MSGLRQKEGENMARVNKELIVRRIQALFPRMPIEYTKNKSPENDEKVFYANKIIKTNLLNPLDVAIKNCDLTSVKHLLTSKVGPDDVNEKLISAIKSGCPQIVRLLLEYGADANCVTRKDKSPLIEALKKNSLEIVEILLEYRASVGVYYFTTRYQCILPLQLAIKYDCEINIIKALVKNGSKVNCPENCLLNDSAYHGRGDVFEYLTEAGAKLYYKNNTKTMIRIIRNGNVELLRLFLRAGADLRAPERFGCSYLHEAAAIGYDPNIIDTLIEFGADVKSLNIRQHTALKVSIDSNKIKNCYALLLNDANACINDDLVASLLKISGSCFNIIVFLLMNGMDSSIAIIGYYRNRYPSCMYFDNKIEIINEILARFGGYYDSSIKLTKEAFCKSLIKIRVAKLPLNSKQANVVKKLELIDFELEYSYEIERMKNTVMYDELTVYDFLRATKRSLVVHMCNPVVECRDQFKAKCAEFKIYKVLLWINYMRGMYYKPMYQTAHDNLFRTFNHVLPYNIIDQILEYLTLRDTYSLYKLYGFKRSHENNFYDVLSKVEYDFFN